MSASKVNILNSICLITVGLWGYLEVTSPTALIPVGFGAALAFCIPGVKKGKQSHCTCRSSFNFCYTDCASWK